MPAPKPKKALPASAQPGKVNKKPVLTRAGKPTQRVLAEKEGKAYDNPALGPDGKIRKGFSLNPAGRPKGAKTRLCQMTPEDRKKLAEEFGMTPLEFLLSVMADNTEIMPHRLDAAKTAAPYMHRKMPIAIEGGDTPIMLYDTASLAKLNDKEMAQFTSILAKLTAASQKEDGE